MLARALALGTIALAASCEQGPQPPPQPARCMCKPENIGPEVWVDHSEKPQSRVDSGEVLELLRWDVVARDDDHKKLKLFVEAFCRPCRVDLDSWSLADMFPLDRVDDAVGAGCLFLELRDGTRAYGPRFDKALGSACR